MLHKAFLLLTKFFHLSVNVQYFSILQNDDWISLKPAVASSEDGRFFTLEHTFTNLVAGVYEAQLKAKNSYGWSELSETKTFPKGMSNKPYSLLM